MHLATAKCWVTNHGTKNVGHTAKMGDRILECSDLRGKLDNQLNLCFQWDDVAKRANTILGYIRRSLLNTVSSSGVHPSGCRQAGKVQERATRMTEGLENLPYHERPREINLFNLSK